MKIRLTLGALLWIAFTADPAGAAQRHAVHPDCNVRFPCDLRYTQQDAKPSKREQARRARGKRIERAMPFGRATQAKPKPVAVRTPLPVPRPSHSPTSAEFFAAVQKLLTPLDSIAAALDHVTQHVVPDRYRPPPTIAGFLQRVVTALGPSVSLRGVVPALAAKAQELQRECGSRVISAVRNTRIAGTRRISLHASGEAVDMAGNPECMYKLLAKWPGGVSQDYHRIRPPHIHISLAEKSGREMGARFAHGGRKKVGRVRYASAR